MQTLKEQKAEACLQQGDLDGAIRLWKESAREGADASKIAQWISQLHALHCTSFCGELLNALLTHEGGMAQDYLGVAKLYFLLARFDTASLLTSCALDREPENPDIMTMLASCNERTNDTEQAAKILHQVLEKHPGHGRATRVMARIERRRENFAQARHVLTRHLQQFPSSEDWRLQYELASVCDRLGEYDAALDNLTKAKNQLAPQVPHQQSAQLGQRQWQVARKIDTTRLARWREHANALSPRQNVCFLGGFPRSGTTLLENILCSHPRCIGTDETGILSAQFIKPLVIQASSADAAVEELDDFHPEDVSAGRAEYLRCTEDYIGERIEGRWLVEKEPLLTPDLAVPLRLFPDAKILMPLRDPRDVIISYLFTIVPLNAESAGASDFGSACQFYADVMRHWIHLREILPPEQWMESRYEHLLADPEGQTKQLAEFLGIGWSTSMVSHHKKDPGKRQVSTPTYDDVSKPLYTRSLNRWRNYEDQLKPHLHHLEPYIQAFGYE